MHLQVFFQTFYLVFLILSSVGPGFLTIANIAITRGCKTSAIAVCGCFLGDCILITAGAFCAKKIISTIPQTLTVMTSLMAVFLIFYLAYRFWTVNIKDIKANKIDKKNGFSLAVVLFCLKMSSPISIIGYGVIFTQVINQSNATLSACFGGYLASFTVNALMVLIFGKIGRKINVKIMKIINKISSVFISCFALILLVAILKEIIKF